jgi:mono/diheme cytochrome c family protein
MRFVPAITVGTLAALLAAAAASSGGARASDAPDVAAGRALFMANGCAQCHGTVGQGNYFSGPKLAPHPIPYAAFVAQLRKPRNDMPPYSAHLVSDANIAKIYAYVSSVPAAKPAAAIAMLADVGNGNAGAAHAANDPLAAGRAVFTQNCASCHGAAGAGGGVGPALTGERAKKDLAATIAFVKHPQAPMPALYPSPLSDDDVASVAAYVQSL